MYESETESDSGSVLLQKYATFPKMRSGRKYRNINNFRSHMQALADNMDECYFEDPDTKSTFRQVLEDPGRLELVHRFFKLPEDEQEKVINSLNTISEDIEVDDESSIVEINDFEIVHNSRFEDHDGFCCVYPESCSKYKIKTRCGISQLSNEIIKFLNRHHSLDFFEEIERELRMSFCHGGNCRWQNYGLNDYERYITHIIAKYLGLSSESYNGCGKKRVIRVFNRMHYFAPPDIYLSREMEHNNVFIH